MSVNTNQRHLLTAIAALRGGMSPEQARRDVLERFDYLSPIHVGDIVEQAELMIAQLEQARDVGGSVRVSDIVQSVAGGEGERFGKVRVNYTRPNGSAGAHDLLVPYGMNDTLQDIYDRAGDLFNRLRQGKAEEYPGSDPVEIADGDYTITVVAMV